MADDAAIIVTRMTIPEKQWRGFLSSDVVDGMVTLYLRRHHPKYVFSIDSDSSGVTINISAQDRSFTLKVIDGVVHIASVDNLAIIGGKKQVAQKLVTELTELLDFTADLHVERIVQFTAEDLAEENLDEQYSREYTEGEHNTGRRVIMFTLHPLQNARVAVRVLLLPRGRLEIRSGGQDASKELAQEAAERTIAALREHGLDVEVVSSME